MTVAETVIPFHEDISAEDWKSLMAPIISKHAQDTTTCQFIENEIELACNTNTIHLRLYIMYTTHNRLYLTKRDFAGLPMFCSCSSPKVSSAICLSNNLSFSIKKQVIRRFLQKTKVENIFKKLRENQGTIHKYSIINFWLSSSYELILLYKKALNEKGQNLGNKDIPTPLSYVIIIFWQILHLMPLEVNMHLHHHQVIAKRIRKLSKHKHTAYSNKQD